MDIHKSMNKKIFSHINVNLKATLIEYADFKVGN